MVSLIGYFAYVLICATGVIQATAMIRGRNFVYSIWSALSIETGLILLQCTLGTGPAPLYVIVGNAVSVVANGVCLAYMLKPSPKAPCNCYGFGLDHCVEDTENVATAPLAPQSIFIPAAVHNHGPYGYRDGVAYWERIEGCEGCSPFVFNEADLREV